MTGTIFTLIPALLTIVLVVLTKRVIMSLAAGVLAAALLVAEFNIGGTFTALWESFSGVIFGSGNFLGFLNRWYMSIILFLFALGVITSFVVLSGGAQAFTSAIIKKVKNREGVQYTSMVLGLLLFIDDYFNALVVGNVSKPLADETKLSRARIAYIVDSTSAPICIAAPISSWATAIMGTMAVIFTTHGVQYNTFSAFLRMVPYHFYVITALALVLITTRFDFNMGMMKKYEAEVAAGNDTSKAAAELVHEDTDISGASKGSIWDLILPIVVLTAVTIGVMFYTGYTGARESGGYEEGLLYAILDNIGLSWSLVWGALAGLATTMIMTARHVVSKDITGAQYGRAFGKGLKSMLTAIMILILAWIISDLIGELELGEYIAGLISGASIPYGLVPVIMFVIAAIMAFATGTSWGTFGIVLPIAGAVAAAIDINLLLPAMSAVLSGAVLGDHASPISDTTLLSSAGTGCDVHAHFVSQLPYAVLAGIVAALGYLTYGFTSSLLVSYLVIIAAMAGIALFAKSRQTAPATQKLSKVKA